jgi:uncharacterized protein (TIRG00374 family)
VRVISNLLRRWRPPGWLLHGLQYLAGIGVSTLFVLLFLHKVDFSRVGDTLQRAKPLYLAPVAGFFMLSYYLQAVRWRHLVRHIAGVSTRDAFPRVLVSNTAGALLPFQLGQVLMVQVSAEKFRMDRTALFGAEFVSRMMDGLIFAIFLAIALVMLHIGSAFTALTGFMLFGTITGLLLTWWLTRRHPHKLEQSRWPFAAWVQRIHDSVWHPLLRGLSSMQDPRQVLDIFVLTLGIWGTEAAFYWMVGLALDVHVNPLAYVFLVSAANIGAGMPLAQAGVGFILLAQLAFVAVGQSRDVATAYALSLQALIVAPIIVLGPLAVWGMHLTWHDVFPWVDKPAPNEHAAGERRKQHQIEPEHVPPHSWANHP